jgi:hypothetical protein
MDYDISDVKKKVERVTKTLKCIEPDRIPLHDFFWTEFIKRWQKEKNLPEDTNIYYYYDMDMMVISPNMDPKKKSYKLIEKGDNYTIWESGFGCKLKKVDYSPMPMYFDFSIKSSDEYENFEFDDPNDKDRYYSIRQDIVSGDGFTPLPSFANAIKEAKDKICIFGSVCEGHEALWRMRGPEDTYMDLATDPEKVKKFVERIGDYMIEIGKRQLEFNDVKGLVIWGDVAYKNGMLFSPNLWRQIFYPVVKKMCAEFHKMGALIIYHGCGDTRVIIDDLIETGIDAYHTLEVKAGMDVVKLKKKYKNKLSYLGNLDALNVLPGSKDNMKKDLLYRLNAAKGGGYMPGADHSVPGNVSAENYDYLISLIKEYGKYPLNLGDYNVDIG